MEKQSKGKDLAMVIDTGGTNCRMLYIDKIEGILVEDKFSLSELKDEKDLYVRVITWFEDTLNSKNIDPDRIRGVTHGAAGVSDRKTFTLKYGTNFPEGIRENIELVKNVAEHFSGKPNMSHLKDDKNKAIINDCSAGALGELYYGWKPPEVIPFDQIGVKPLNQTIEGNQEAIPYAFWIPEEPKILPPSFKDIVYVTLSTGHNIGLVIEGKLFNGAFGTSPEYGHKYWAEKDLFGNKIKCGCGGEGHLEGVISGSGLSNVIIRGIQSGDIKKDSLYEHIRNQERINRANVLAGDYDMHEANNKKVLESMLLANSDSHQTQGDPAKA